MAKITSDIGRNGGLADLNFQVSMDKVPDMPSLKTQGQKIALMGCDENKQIKGAYIDAASWSLEPGVCQKKTTGDREPEWRRRLLEESKNPGEWPMNKQYGQFNLNKLTVSELLLHVRQRSYPTRVFTNESNSRMAPLAIALNRLKGAKFSLEPLRKLQIRFNDHPWESEALGRQAYQWLTRELAQALTTGKIAASELANAQGINFGIPKIAQANQDNRIALNKTRDKKS